jgi:phenylalanyl-tRNA synthetase alpha chain
VTLPGRPRRQGTIHPISQVTEEVTAIFADMGFSVAEGPQIETDWHNFDALNIPGHHPARAEMDTFYMARAAGDDRPPHVLRTHTSPVQIRSMLANGAPLRIIAPGRVYRADYDQTHTPMFHQVEGLAIDRSITMANLKWVLEEFVPRLLRGRRRGAALPRLALPLHRTLGRGRHPLLLGRRHAQARRGRRLAGDPRVGHGAPEGAEAGGIDPSQWQGFAFGMGIDRIAMLKYGIPDLRAFFESDLRWLRHYGFAPLDVPTLHGGLSR